MVLPISNSTTMLLSVSEMVDYVYNEQLGIADFRILHALLLILARGLNILYRRIRVICPFTRVTGSTMTIKEVTVTTKRKHRAIRRKSTSQANGIRKHKHLAEQRLKNFEDKSKYSEASDSKMGHHLSRQSSVTNKRSRKRETRGKQDKSDNDSDEYGDKRDKTRKGSLKKSKDSKRKADSSAQRTASDKSKDEDSSSYKQSQGKGISSGASSKMDESSPEDSSEIDERSVKAKTSEIQGRSYDKDGDGDDEKSASKKSKREKQKVVGSKSLKSKDEDKGKGKSSKVPEDIDKGKSSKLPAETEEHWSEESSEADARSTDFKSDTSKIKSQFSHKQGNKHSGDKHGDKQGGRQDDKDNAKFVHKIDGQDDDNDQYDKNEDDKYSEKDSDAKKTASKISKDKKRKAEGDDEVAIQMTDGNLDMRRSSQESQGKLQKLKGVADDEDTSISSKEYERSATGAKSTERSKKTTRTTEAGSTEKKKKRSPKGSEILASMESSEEIVKETILIVESEPAGKPKGTSKKATSEQSDQSRAPQSMVTMEQFLKLEKAVDVLKERFGFVDIAGVDNIEFLKTFHKGASLSDPMAILQLSARLEVTEQALNQMTSVIKDLNNRAQKDKQKGTGAFSPGAGLDRKGSTDSVTSKAQKGSNTKSGVDSKADVDAKGGKYAKDKTDTTGGKGIRDVMDTKAGSERAADSAGTTLKIKLIATHLEDPKSKHSKKMDDEMELGFLGRPKGKLKEESGNTMTEIAFSEPLRRISEPMSAPTARSKAKSIISDKNQAYNPVTEFQLRRLLQEVKDQVLRSVISVTKRVETAATNTTGVAKTLVGKLAVTTSCGEKFDMLEHFITKHAEKIANIDANISTMMTNFQEEITQMQNNLEVSLDNMAESLANRKSDTDDVMDLNNLFTVLQIDLDRTAVLQNDLLVTQDNLSMDLTELLEQMEKIRKTKSDRDEVQEALNTKAGIAELNGIVSLAQYEAACGELQKTIATAFDIFNSQEVIWQKNIDDLGRNINDKVEKYALDNLVEDINKKSIFLDKRLQFMLDICWRPEIVANKKAIRHEGPCLSCGSLPREEKKETHIYYFDKGPRTKPEGSKTEARKLTVERHAKDKKRKSPQIICYPNTPIPHSSDSRAPICLKFGGGTSKAEDVSSTVIVKHLERKKPCTSSEVVVNFPCRPCNVKSIETYGNAITAKDADKSSDFGTEASEVTNESSPDHF